MDNRQSTLTRVCFRSTRSAPGLIVRHSRVQICPRGRCFSCGLGAVWDLDGTPHTLQSKLLTFSGEIWGLARSWEPRRLFFPLWFIIWPCCLLLFKFPLLLRAFLSGGETGGGMSLQTENHRARWSPRIPSPAAHWDLEGREVRDPSLGTPTQGCGGPGPGLSDPDCKLFFLLLCAWASENGDVSAAPGGLGVSSHSWGY